MKLRFSLIVATINLLLLSNFLYSQHILIEKFDDNWTSNSTIHSPAPTLRNWDSDVGVNNARAWHRNDYLTNWTNTGAATSPSANGANSTPYYARFHSRAINNNTTLLYTPTIDMTSHQNDEVFLSFYFIDPDGANDYVNLLFSSNNGGNYETFVTLADAVSWTKYTIIIPRKYLTSQFKLAFLGVKTNNGNTTDIGIDEVEIYKAINVTSSATLPICSGGSTNLTATSLGSGTSYSWSPSSGLSSTSGQVVTANPTTTTTYTVTATRSGFSHSKSFTVGVNPLPEISSAVFPNGADACNVDYISLEANVPSTTTPYNETFGNGAGWTISGLLDYINGAIPNSNNAGGTAPEGRMLYFDGSNIFSDWYLYPNDGNVNNYLPISLENLSSATLQFRHYFDYYAGNYDRNISVEVSSDLINWNTVWSMRNVTNDVGPALASGINLNNYVNSTIYIRFRYSGDSWGMDNWYLDDITITGTYPTYTFSPTTGLYTDINLSTPYAGGVADMVYAIPDGTVSYTLHSTVGACSRTDSESLTSNSSKFFTTSGNWNTPASWRPEVVPTINKCVKIPDGATVTVNTNIAEAKSLEISQNGKLTIPQNMSLTVQDEINIINNVANDNLVVESDANLLQINPATNTGNITVKRAATVPSNQYNYWSSPVKDQVLYSLYPGIPSGKVMTYNTSTDYFTALPLITNPISQFGKGYSIKGSNQPAHAPNVTANFVGVPQNESLTSSQNIIPLSSAGNRFNLIGNPFPSNLNLDDLYNHAPNSDAFDGTYYFWDNTNNTILNQQGSGYAGNNYAIYNANSGGIHAAGGDDAKIPNGIVKPGQGFIVKALPGGTQLMVANNMRTKEVKINVTDEDAPYYKNGNNNATDDVYGSRPRNDKFWLELITPGEVHIQILMGYFAKAENTFEKFDTKVLNESVSDNIYSFSKDAFKLAIQGRSGPFTKDDVIPLGTKFFGNGKYRIQLKDTRGIFKVHQDIYLKDKYQNSIHNLSKDGAYEFVAPKGEFTDRFEIVYMDENFVSHTPLESISNVKIQKINNQIVIYSEKEKIVSVEIFNLAGWSVYRNEKIQSNELQIPATQFDKEIIVVKVLTKTGELVTKKFINK